MFFFLSLYFFFFLLTFWFIVNGAFSFFQFWNLLRESLHFFLDLESEHGLFIELVHQSTHQCTIWRGFLADDIFNCTILDKNTFGVNLNNCENSHIRQNTSKSHCVHILQKQLCNKATKFKLLYLLFINWKFTFYGK